LIAAKYTLYPIQPLIEKWDYFLLGMPLKKGLQKAMGRASRI